MKRIETIYILLLLSLINISAYAENNENRYIQGEIYLKLKNDQPALEKYYSRDVNIASELPFLQQYLNEYGINFAKRSFWFSKSEILKRTFRIQFSEYDKIDQLVNILSRLPEVEYAEKIPLCKLDYTPNDLGPDGTGNGDQYSLYLI